MERKAVPTAQHHSPVQAVVEQYLRGEAISVSIFFEVHNTSKLSNDEFASGSLYILSVKSQIAVMLFEFV